MNDRPICPVQSARDVPALRDTLLDGWQPGGIYDTAARIAPGTTLMELGGARPEHEFHLQALNRAALYWVSAEMCEVLAHAERTVPDDTILEHELVPHHHGLVVFERPLYGLDAQTSDSTVQVNAMCWGPVNLSEYQRVIGGGLARLDGDPRAGLGMVCYSRYNMDDGLHARSLMHALATGAIAQALADEPDVHGTSASFAVHGDIWAWLGRGDWLFNHAVAHKDAPYTDQAFASIAEDRRRLVALWLLMAQPGMTTVTTDLGSRGERRRAARNGRAAPVVQLVDVARSHRRAVHDDDGGEHRHVTVRYAVTGHWRRQAYGEGRKYRRPVWIAPHWRGPDDAPLSNVERVRVVR
jgi:hypothetical protein